MKIFVVFVLMIIETLNCCAQIDIYLSDYKINITPKKCNDKRSIYLTDSSLLKIDLLNCKGKMNIQQFGKTGILLLSGQYCASLDTLKQYVQVLNLSLELVKIKVRKFFEPLKDGTWIYYQNGQIDRKEKYNKGILIKE
jgi:hypothetical protein